MAFVACAKRLVPALHRIPKSRCIQINPVRNIVSKQLVYTRFGDPLEVIKCREARVPVLGPQDVLVRMLAAPVNPADINTIQGTYPKLPKLPSVGGDEGVGDVVEIGCQVAAVRLGQRVVLAQRQLGSWRFYGIFNERHLHVISPTIPIPEAAMISIAPCTALRLLMDYHRVHPMETVIQTAANSAVGQSVIQICKAWGIKTFNIVSSNYAFDSIKKHLMSLGATGVFTLDEALEYLNFNTSLSRPVLALNCLGGKYEDVLIRMLQKHGTMVYYGAYSPPLSKHTVRGDLTFHKFNLNKWHACATCVQKSVMMNEIIKLMAIGKFCAPYYQPLEINNYMQALKDTAHCDAFSTKTYIFDLTLT